MIEITGLVKRYGAITALDGVDLRVRAGEMLVVLGPSGAGKSTLLHAINRLVPFDAGSVTVEGVAVPADGAALRAVRRRIGMIFQDHNLVPRLTVLKNVLTGRLGALPLAASLAQVFAQRDIDVALECLDRVELRGRAFDRADRLSGGQQQRVGIARALAQQPAVILADEPVASLDPKTARLVLGDLRRAAHELGIAVLCNLHQVPYARSFADRVVGMHAGRIVFEGAPDQLDAGVLGRIYPGLALEAALA